MVRSSPTRSTPGGTLFVAPEDSKARNQRRRHRPDPRANPFVPIAHLSFGWTRARVDRTSDRVQLERVPQAPPRNDAGSGPRTAATSVSSFPFHRKRVPVSKGKGVFLSVRGWGRWGRNRPWNPSETVPRPSSPGGEGSRDEHGCAFVPSITTVFILPRGKDPEKAGRPHPSVRRVGFVRERIGIGRSASVIAPISRPGDDPRASRRNLFLDLPRFLLSRRDRRRRRP